MHMVPEEPIEVAYLFVAKHRRNGADLGWGEYAEQPPAESQPNLYLILQQCLPVSGHEIALQRAHLYAQFASNGLHMELYMTVKGLDKVMHHAGRIIEEPRAKMFVVGCSHGSDCGNHLLFNGRQFSGRAFSHRRFLTARTSTEQQRCARNNDLRCVGISLRVTNIRDSRVGRRRTTMKHYLFDRQKRPLHHLRCQQNPPLFPIINSSNRGTLA
jgi:hypothetical protein